MIFKPRILPLLILLAVGIMASVMPVQAASEERVPARAPTVLIINQQSAQFAGASDNRGKQVEMLIRHFTPNTVLLSESRYVPRKLFDFDQVVVIGNDANTPLSPALLNDVTRARRPVLWIGYGLKELPVDMEATYGFSPGYWTDQQIPTSVEYHDKMYAAKLVDYSQTHISSSAAHVYARYVGGRDPVPYIVQGGDLWYVNGLPSLGSAYPDPAQDAPTLIFADVLHDYFGMTTPAVHNAVVRLEDVSALVDPARLIAAVDYLSSEHVPFAMGVIAAQRMADGSIATLSDHPAVVNALLYAQGHGGTIILHGYHHGFGSSEDYEFWDINRNAPLPGETWQMYASAVEDGIRVLRDYGIYPQLWETPHYAASPLAYRVFSSYFSYAFENRTPASWLPYPSGPDEYGQTLIPENLGYINPAEGLTVDMQLQRASLLQIVRDGWAAGYYHPANISVSELQALVTGLCAQGYTFFDLRTLPLQVYDNYRPGVLMRLVSKVETKLPWWTVVRRIPWVWLCVASFAAFFLFRLRAQWQTGKGHTRSDVEGKRQPKRRARRYATYPVRVGLLLLLGLTLLTTSGWGLSSNDGAPFVRGNAPDPLEATTEPLPDAQASPSSDAWRVSDGWQISVYYTAVEKYHSGPPQEVYGCLSLDCVNGTDLLGSYPRDFVEAVKEQGNGRVTSGVHDGQYLNWAIDTGYWIDDLPRDARGLALQPYISAAADPSIPYLTTFKVVNCGADVHTSAPISNCEHLDVATWIVRDRFTVGQGGKQIDLYIGEEDQSDFMAKTAKMITTTNATIAFKGE